MDCDTAKSQVFPYVDGELPAEPRSAMEAHLAGCQTCRLVVEHESLFRETYVTRLRPDPAPPALREKVARLLAGLAGPAVPAPAARRRALPWRHALVAVLLLAVGLVAGMKLAVVRERGDMLTRLADASVDQHQKLVRGLLPPDIVGVSPKTAEEWLRKRLDFNVTVPELTGRDVTLLGARISHLDSVEVAALEYQLDRKHVSLFVIPEEAYKRLGLNEKPKFKTLRHRGYDVIVWRHHGTGYTLVSEIGGRSCLVCHSPDDRVDTSLESFVDL